MAEYGEDVIPALEEDSESSEDGDAAASSQEPKGPRDDIRVTVQSFQKTGEDYTYDVEVEVNGQTKLVHRCYKDLQWLHRNLSRRVELGGYILPPMPALPPKSPEASSAILGEISRALFGDNVRLPCMAMEVFLQALADHRFFAENETVHSYVTSEQLGPRDQLGVGTLWSQLTKRITNYQLSSVQDTDSEFVSFLAYISELTPALQDASQDFAQLSSAQLTFACSVVSSNYLFKDIASWDIDKNNNCSRAINKLVEGTTENKQYLHSTAMDGRNSIGFTLDLYHKYCIQAKEMLFRRLYRLQSLLSATATLDKAKPEKKAAAEVVKEEADRAFHLISETARKEIALFKEHYASSFQSSLVGYTECQIAHSKRTLENLSKVRDELEQLGTD